MSKLTYQQRGNLSTRIPVSQLRTAGGKVLEDNRAAFNEKSPLGATKKNSPLVIQQTQLAEMGNSSPTMASQRNIVESVNSSPYIATQRQRVDGLSGGSTRQLKAEPLPEKLQLTQQVEKPAPMNNTGLPDPLKNGIEALSGLSMDNVKVHYNSAKPAQMNALAYAQGTDIHVGPGQEKHLPHEAWHVVQQAQGRVKPTMQMKGDVSMNDDKNLEREADAMGTRANTLTRQKAVSETLNSPEISPSLMQLKWITGARPYLLMWDKLVEGAQWYYIEPGNKHALDKAGGMFYTKGNYISEIRTRENWLSQSGATELEDADGEVIDVREAVKSLSGSLPSWSVVINETSPSNFTESAKSLNQEWTSMPQSSQNRSEPGENECSGPDWTQHDEGVDVSTELAEDPELAENAAISGGISIPYIAFYAGDETEQPIALMMLETRQELPNWKTPEKPHLYIRWLLGSPKRKGGGGALVQYAKVVAHLREEVQAISVESAASAVEWYKNQGYKEVAPSTHEDGKTACRCVYLAWPPEQADVMKNEHGQLTK